MRPLSLTARVSLLFAAVLTAVLLALGGLAAWSVDRHFRAMDRSDLEGKLALVRNLLARAGAPTAMDEVLRELDDALVGHEGLSVTLSDGAGERWFASRGLSYPAALFQAPARDGLATWRDEGRGYRGLRASVRSGDGRMFDVAIVLDISHHQHFLDELKRTLALAVALAALLGAGLGWLAVHTGLRPLRRLTAWAAGLSASRLGERLPEDGLPAEMRPLAEAFNGMLARLDDAFTRLSEFSSDIAHELRTPVATLMTQTQVALARARSAEEYRETLLSAGEEYERLARMIDDMLFLAKADNRLIVPGRAPVDLAAEAAGLIEFHGIVAEERGIRLELAGAATVPGDRLMLRRALSNLLANAIRHCPAGAAVAVRLESGPAGARVAVENPGSIPAGQLPRLFDRFYTGDPARHEGVGLGLAIVRSIVEAHGGSVAAESAAGLVRFVVRLPG